MKYAVILAAFFTVACGSQGTTYTGQAPACVVTKVDPSATAPGGGALIQCLTSSALVLNGLSTYAIAELVDPCDNTPGFINEILLKLQDGTVVALMADSVAGYNPRLSSIPPGAYMTTDGTNCHFSVATGGIVTW